MSDDFWKDAEIISVYPMEQGVEDGMLVEVFKHRWPQLSGGKPIVSTPGPHAEFSEAALIEIWNAYVGWRRDVEPTLPEEDKMFVTQMNGKDVWVIEDGAAFTILFPDEY